MKKQFFACFTVLSIAAIAANRSNLVTVNNSTSVRIYDTVPDKKDTTWRDTTDRPRDTSMIRTNSSLHK